MSLPTDAELNATVKRAFGKTKPPKAPTAKKLPAPRPLRRVAPEDCKKCKAKLERYGQRCARHGGPRITRSGLARISPEQRARLTAEQRRTLRGIE